MRNLYLDSSQPVDKRVKDLLGRMTLEEKIRQTGFIMGKKLVENKRFSAILTKKLLGNMSIGGIMDPQESSSRTAKIINVIQKYLVTKTRLGIPALIMGECLHGHLSPDATIFPQSIGLSCSWNPGLIKKIAEAVAKEASSVGIRQTFSPDLDIARDPRWGRVEETYGEDTYLCSRLGVAYIEGVQGRKGEIVRDKLVATPKHFAAHCAPEGGINIAPADVGIRKLREEYLPPFKAAVEAGVLSIMPAYNEIDGIPCAASEFLLQKILREEWGFEGYTFSDFGSIDMLTAFHNVAVDLQEAGRQAFEAGLDMEAPEIKCFGKNLLELVKKGVVSRARLDEAVGRILRVKFLAGLFESPYVDEDKVKEIVHCNRHVKLARKAAGESIVLLKNKDNLLPLDKNVSSIAVIGPNADVAECGGYCFPKLEDISPLKGISEAVSQKTKVNFAPGCDMHDLSREGFKEAMRIARDSDVAIMFVGGSSMGRKTTRPSTCGEGFDRTNLNLSGVQQELVEAVAAAGTPVVVVVINGRPLSIVWIAEHIPAILEAWYPGEQGGHAIADILFGKTNPSAKLTMSFPRSVGQVPKYYSQKPSSRGIYKKPGSPGKPGRDYVYSQSSPLYEFGHGLSYTSFHYSNLRITPKKMCSCEKVRVRVEVKNTGKREGDEVVQLYVNDVVSSVTTPVKALKRFKKIRLKPGDKKEVKFMLNAHDLSLINRDMKPVVESGKFEVMTGGLKDTFEVI